MSVVQPPSYIFIKKVPQHFNSVKTQEQMATERHNNELSDSKFNRVLKFVGVYLAFGIAIAWLGFIGSLVWKFLKLDPYNTKVMIALLTTSTATVVGLPAIALRGTFKVLQEENKAMELKNKLNNQ